MPSEEPCRGPGEKECDIVVAAGVTIESSDLELLPRTVEDSVITVPSYKRDSLDEQSALTSETDEKCALTSKIDEESTLASKPTTPSGTKLPPDSAMTVMQGHASTASSPSSVLLAKHWGPERMVEILREPNCSLGISIVGGKVRCNQIKGTLEETV